MCLSAYSSNDDMDISTQREANDSNNSKYRSNDYVITVDNSKKPQME
jgi:hypothetical protein